MAIEHPRVLCLFSAPLVAPDGGALAALDVAAEQDAIVRELSALNRQIDLRIAFATVNELARGIRDGYNILHLSGHGHPDFLLFEDGKGGSQKVTGEYLKKLIGTGGPFELAIVSACHSQRLGELIVEAGVRHVCAIRHSEAVLDKAGIAFIGHFFANLFCQQSIGQAFDIATLLVEGDPDLAEIRPFLELQAKKEGEPFVPEERKFILLPERNPSVHQGQLTARPVAEGTLSIETPRRCSSNLPGRPTTFTGRSADMHEAIRELLTHRLVTLKGAGGMGKTTMAVEVARWFQSRGHFPDGMWMVDLREAESVEAAVALIGAALGRELATVDHMVKFLEGRQVLLLLDNAEDLLWKQQESARNLIDLILKYAPRVRLLVTAQRPVGGTLHEPERVVPLWPLTTQAAKSLFCRAAKRDITSEEYDSETLHDLLHQLGGHPLSIAVMARQLAGGVTISDLIARIETHKGNAVGPKTGVPGDLKHSESLVAALASAYDNVSEGARETFAALTLLPAGAQDSTLRQLLGETGWDSALELEEASLVAIILPMRRAVLLPPVRLFGLAIIRDETKNVLGPRIVGLMAAYASQFYGHMGREDAKEYRKFFTLEEPNFRGSLDLPTLPAQNPGAPSLLGRLAVNLLLLYLHNDRVRDGVPAGAIVLGSLRKQGDTWGEAYTLFALGNLAMRTNELADAKARYNEALKLYRKIDDQTGEANTLNSLGDLAIRTNALADAKARYNEALELYRKIDGQTGEANTLKSLGDLAIRTNALADAKARYNEALELYRKIDDQLGEANTLKSLGDLAIRTDALADAKARYNEALELYRKIDAQVGEANTLYSLGDLAIRTDALADAKARYNEALELYRKIDDQLGEANTLKSLGDLAIRTNALADAKARYNEALELYRKIDAQVGEANTLYSLGDLAMRTDALAEAKARYNEALELYRKIDAQMGEANTLKSLGDLAMRTDALAEAKARYNEALELYRKIDAQMGEANTLKSLGDLAMRTDALAEAKARYNEALELHRKIDDQMGEANTLKSLGDLAMRTDALAEAKARYNEALELYRKIDSQLGGANTLKSLGDLAMRMDSLADAKARYNEALELYQMIEERMGEGETRARLGMWLLVEDDLEEAATALANAHEIAHEVGNSTGLATVCLGRAFLSFRRGKGDEGKGEMERCLGICDKAGDNGWMAWWSILWVDHLVAKERREEATIFLDFAEKLASRIVDPALGAMISERRRAMSS